MAGAFVATMLIAKVFGAGWGTASGFGQIAFVIAVVAVILAADR
jgi:hypothetical protein